MGCSGGLAVLPLLSLHVRRLEELHRWAGGEERRVRGDRCAEWEQRRQRGIEGTEMERGGA